MAEPTEEELETIWSENISDQVTACLQGREDVPENMAPFDAASEMDMDQQRVEAMLRIQSSLRDGRPGEAIALFRAAREVWPEGDEFGSADMAEEEEFMALREIFMAALPRE
ncbi:timeless-like protein [Elysia marginata]|uniref:Timeless-like protein n=1 Tax=Elysia marginata TaxID=1093978 RepID=A0AAV4IM21_9GAST|nr:timeless-like protein [Elysia marginata]